MVAVLDLLSTRKVFQTCKIFNFYIISVLYVNMSLTHQLTTHLLNKNQEWIYSDINKIFEKHPECKLWFFCNGCGANFYFISGVIENLYQHYEHAINNGSIGFVTSSGSGLPVTNLRIHDPNSITWETLYCFIYNKTGNSLYDDVYKWVTSNIKNSKKWEYSKKEHNFKHIVVTSSLNSNSELDWFYHDCSTNSNIPDNVYIKTTIASAYLGFIDPQSNWKGIDISNEHSKNITIIDSTQMFHFDGWIWRNPPPNTNDLFNLLGIECYSLSFMSKALYGLLFASRTECLKWYINGFNKCNTLLNSTDSLLNKCLYNANITCKNFYNTTVLYSNYEIAIPQSRLKSLWNVFNFKKLYKDTYFITKIIKNKINKPSRSFMKYMSVN